MKRLRFCFPTTFYPPYSFGGDGINVQRLARALVNRGHSVTVVHDVDAFEALGGKAQYQVPERDGVKVVCLRSGWGAISPLLTQQTGHPLGNSDELRRVLGSGEFDIINFHNISLLGGPGLLAYGNGVAKLYTAHEHWLVCPTHVLWRHLREPCPARQCVRCQLVYKRPPQLWRHTRLLQRNLHHVDQFLAFSEFSRNKHHEFGFPRDMMIVPALVPAPSTDVKVTAKPGEGERPYFLFAGRLEKIKGLDDVIPVFRTYHDADLIIAGDGEHAVELRRIAAGASNVRFVGRVDYSAMTRYYMGAVATLVPSVGFETFGSVAVESLAHGTPVIGRDQGGVGEILRQSGGGELFTHAATLPAALHRLQNDSAHRSRCSDRGREAYAARWSEGAVIPRYLEIVSNVLRRRGNCAPS